RRHTRFSRDWSSDVCSSDLRRPPRSSGDHAAARGARGEARCTLHARTAAAPLRAGRARLLPGIVSAGRVIIHYHRPPDRYERFEQHLVHRTHDCVVTLLDAASVSRDIVIDGVTALEPGASVVWFTFRDAWHDIGRFHTRD